MLTARCYSQRDIMAMQEWRGNPWFLSRSNIPSSKCGMQMRGTYLSSTEKLRLTWDSDASICSARLWAQRFSLSHSSTSTSLSLSASSSSTLHHLRSQFRSQRAEQLLHCHLIFLSCLFSTRFSPLRRVSLSPASATSPIAQHPTLTSSPTRICHRSHSLLSLVVFCLHSPSLTGASLSRLSTANNW